MTSNNLNVGITGATGFLGSHIVRALSQKNVEYETFDRNKYDLCKSESLKEFVQNKHVIIHAGALNIGSIIDLLKANVLGIAGLLEAISLYNPLVKFIFISSAQVYLDNNIYGLSKKMGEELVEHFSRQKKVTGFILRMTNLYGSDCKPFYNSALTTFIYQAVCGEEITINGDGSQTRDYLYVLDGVDAIMQSINKKIKGIEILDICSGEKHSLNDVIQLLRRIYIKDIRIRYNTHYVSDRWNFTVSPKKAKEVLGWKVKTSFRQGLDNTVRSMEKSVIDKKQKRA